MAGKNIKFSVLVPVYNAEDYLDECVQSVLHQTYQNFEMILVDDGSKDKSGEICDRYAQEHGNIFAHHKENAGQLHTREYAIARATGDYYVFLDSDDTLRENALETICSKINEYNCDCVVYQWERVSNGKILSSAPAFSDICITDRRELYKKCLLTGSYHSMCLKAVKAEIFTNNADYSRYYSVRYGEDMIQSLAVFKNSKKTIFIDSVLYNYTVNPNSVSLSNTYKNPDDVKLDFIQSVLDLLKDEPVWTEEDYAELRIFYNYSLCSKLLAICKQDMPNRKRRELFQHIRSTKHYKNFLAKASYHNRELGKRTYMFNLFQKECDRALIAYLWLYWRIQAVKKILKK